MAAAHGVTENDATREVLAATARATCNPRAVARPVAGAVRDRWLAPSGVSRARGASRATLGRCGGDAIASGAWLARTPVRDRARRGLAGPWTGYALGGDRLAALGSLRTACARVWTARHGLRRPRCVQVGRPDRLARGGVSASLSPDLDPNAVSPWWRVRAEPYFCTGLVNAAEAVLQVSGRAGPVQRPRAPFGAHGSHGIAPLQGNAVAVFEGV